MNILIKSVVEINRLQLKSLGFYISHVEYWSNLYLLSYDVFELKFVWLFSDFYIFICL